ncbi:MAG: ATP-binding protein [Gammaproteobacteria bacterium]|nr:MAG: ATP-binding protein [Gammaproteobacteria bacterium]
MNRSAAPTPSAPAPIALPPGPAALAAAFAAFNEVSRQLTDSYRTLERESAHLRRELRSARQRRSAAARSKAELAGRLAALVEALPGGVVLLDAEGCIQQVNSAACALLGEPLLGEPWTRIRERAFVPDHIGHGELELASGRRVNVARKPLQPGPGQVLLLTDITESRRIEDLLARHRRLATMGEMAAALAHQIRTPLAAALLYASNASRPELPTEQRDTLLGKAVGCMHDLERLIADMLAFARGATLAGQRFSLLELLADVDDSLRPLLGPEQALAVRRLALDVVLTGNREALAGTLVNLAMNALQAGGSSAQVTISARVAGLQVEIRVSDNGPGVPERLRERIFEPFFTSRTDGTGLGLPVARSVARAHHGDVLLVDGAAGQTVFALRLPVAPPASDQTRNDRNAAA